jgi:hypothetical protein
MWAAVMQLGPNDSGRVSACVRGDGSSGPAGLCAELGVEGWIPLGGCMCASQCACVRGSAGNPLPL